MAKIFVPHRYQQHVIANSFWTKYLAIFADPGMGKTVMILRLLHNLKKRNKIKKPTLVIAPLRPCYTVWPKEVKKWAFSSNMTVRVLHGSNKLQELNKPADIYVINPEGVGWLFQVALKGKRNWPFDVLVVDESGKFKNPSSKRLGQMKNRLRRFSRRYILNGTPAPNSIMDLWGQFMIVDEGVQFGRKITHFREEFFHKTGYYGYKYEVNSDGHRDTIYRRAAHMCIVLKAEDHLKLPPLMFNNVIVELPKKAMMHYMEVEDELFTIIDSNELEVKNSAVASMNCRQIASGGLYHAPLEGEKPPASKNREWHLLHNEKDRALVDLVEETAGKPVLIAYEFHHDLVRIKKCLKAAFGIEPPHIGSGISVERGMELEILWNKNKLRYLLGHPQSIAHGLNLQDSACEDVIWYTPTWNLEWYMQYYQRVLRQGMKGRQLRVHHIVANNTVDLAVVARLNQKGVDQMSLKDALIRYREDKNNA